MILDSIARNHAFVDGNKRTGLLSAILTYELNGIRLGGRADKTGEFEELVSWVVTEKPSVEEITPRLKVLATKYQVSGISKFVEKVRAILTPYDSTE